MERVLQWTVAWACIFALGEVFGWLLPSSPAWGFAPFAVCVVVSTYWSFEFVHRGVQAWRRMVQ